MLNDSYFAANASQFVSRKVKVAVLAAGLLANELNMATASLVVTPVGGLRTMSNILVQVKMYRCIHQPFSRNHFD
jgi:hypothetical protein